MPDLRPKARRWMPIIDVPETPCADFLVESFETGVLRLTVRYSWIKGNKSDLQLTFSEARAIRTLWDGDGVDVEANINCPLCSGEWSGEIWPLQEIDQSPWRNSTTFSMSVAIADQGHELLWRHYRVLASARSIDILARGEIEAVWIPSTDVDDVPVKPPV